MWTVDSLFLTISLLGSKNNGNSKSITTDRYIYKPSTMLPVFYTVGCEDWPAVEEAYNSPFFISGAVMSLVGKTMTRRKAGSYY